MKKTIDEISQWLKSELAISLQNEEYERASGIKKALEKIENGDRPLASPPDDLNLVIDFRLITKESEIKNTDFVIIYYIKEYDQTELDDWNIQEIQGKKYIIIPFIGIYESFLKECLPRAGTASQSDPSARVVRGARLGASQRKGSKLIGKKHMTCWLA